MSGQITLWSDIRIGNLTRFCPDIIISTDSYYTLCAKFKVKQMAYINVVGPIYFREIIIEDPFLLSKRLFFYN